MPKLVLTSLCKHPYQGDLACAYIYYGSKDKPVDHKGNAVGLDGEFPTELIEYLKSNVLSSLKNSLRNTAYQAIEVDVVNQAPHPFISIQRNDGKMITNDDIHNIKRELNTELMRLNQHVNAKNNHLSGLFTKARASKDGKEQAFESKASIKMSK